MRAWLASRQSAVVRSLRHRDEQRRELEKQRVAARVRWQLQFGPKGREAREEAREKAAKERCLEDCVAGLQTEQKQLTQQIQQLQKLNIKQEQKLIVEKEKFALQRSILQAQIDEECKANIMLRKQLETSTTTRQEQKEHLVNEIDRLKMQLSEVNQDYDQIIADQAQLIFEKEALKEQLIEARAVAASSASASSSSSPPSTQQRLDEEQLYEALQNEHKQALADLDDAEAQIEEMEDEVSDLKQDLKLANQKIKLLQEQELDRMNAFQAAARRKLIQYHAANNNNNNNDSNSNHSNNNNNNNNNNININVGKNNHKLIVKPGREISTSNDNSISSDCSSSMTLNTI